MIPPVFAARMLSCPSAEPRFGGELATRYVQEIQTQPDSRIVKDLFQRDGDSFLGDAPPALIQAAGVPARELQNIMAGLAQDLSTMIEQETEAHWDHPEYTLSQESRWWCRNPERMTEATEAFSEKLEARTGLKLAYLSGGAFGTVFRLQAGETNYAFKLYPRGGRVWSGSGNPYTESMMGMHFTYEGVRDMAHCYWANPDQKWLLMEYIDSNASLKDRTGPTLEGLGAVLSDMARGDNDINGIVVDYGCIGWYPKKQA